MQALGCLGNVLWFFPFGLGTGLLWCVAGVFCFISIIGIPWGRACFVMAGFAFMPFGRMPVSRDVLTGEGDIGTGPLGTVGNIVWLLLCGIWIACGHLLSALACAVTIIGIPFAWQHVKLAALALCPIGKTIVDARVADAAEQAAAWRQASGQFRRPLPPSRPGRTPTDMNTASPVLPDISCHEAWFAAYAAREREKECRRDGGDPSPMDLKLHHTMQVLAHARAIVAGGRFAPPLDRACLLAALYHDVARFEQYLRWHTFRDRESCNHGQWGVRILKREQRLKDEMPAVRKLVLAAVGLHNRFALPAGLPEGMARICHAVRDADKLDILRVMDEHLSGPRPYCPTVVLSLPDDPALHSDKVLDDALAGRVAAYADLKSVNDFRVLLGTWFYDMHFPASRARFVAEGHARRLLTDLPATPAYAAARDHLLRCLDAVPTTEASDACLS